MMLAPESKTVSLTCQRNNYNMLYYNRKINRS